MVNTVGPEDVEYYQVTIQDLEYQPLSLELEELTREGWEEILHIGAYKSTGAFAILRRIKPEVRKRLEREAEEKDRAFLELRKNAGLERLAEASSFEEENEIKEAVEV